MRGMDAGRGRPVVMAVTTGVTTGPRGVGAGPAPALIIQVAGEDDLLCWVVRP